VRRFYFCRARRNLTASLNERRVGHTSEGLKEFRMHALPAYLNGVGGSSRGRGARDEGEKLDVLNVLLRNGSLVRDARSSSRRQLQRHGRLRDSK
jgi:hypothetical protein